MRYDRYIRFGFFVSDNLRETGTGRLKATILFSILCKKKKKEEAMFPLGFTYVVVFFSYRKHKLLCYIIEEKKKKERN